MGSQLNFYFNNNLTNPVNAPMNWQDLEIDIAFENESPEATINATTLEWVGPEAYYINNWLKSPTGGIYVGIPLQIQDSISGEVVFNGIINLSDPDNEFQSDIVKVKIQNQQIDLFNGLVQSMNFSFLAQPSNGLNNYIGPLAGQIRPWPINHTQNNINSAGWAGGSSTWNGQSMVANGGDFVTVLYQNNDVPDIESVVTAMLILNEIYQQMKDIALLAVAVVGDVAGAAAGFPSAGAIIIGTLLAILHAAEIILEAALIVAEFNALISMLVPPTRHKFGMFVVTLFTRMAAYFGFNFSSSIFGVVNGAVVNPTVFTNLVWLPVKNAWPTNNTSTIAAIFPGLSGQTSKQYDDYANWQSSTGGSQQQFSYGYPDCSCAEFIANLETVFNARCKIIPDSTGTNSTLYFERWDYNYNLTAYTLPDVSSEAPYADKYTTNAGTLSSNYFLKWQLDSSDLNTTDNFTGNSCICTIANSNYSVPTNGITPSQSTLRNLTTRNIPFSHAIRKDSLTTLENIVNSVMGFINGLISAFNSVTGSHIQKIQGLQSGCLALWKDVTGVPKLFISTGPNNDAAGAFNPTPSGTSYGVSQQNNPHGSDAGIIGDITQPNMSAQSLMQWFHFASQATSPGPPTNKPNTPYIAPYQSGGQTFIGNQWVIYKDEKIPLSTVDFNTIKNNNYIKIGSGPYAGSYAWVDSCKWNKFKGEATISYRIRTVIAPYIYAQYIVDGSYWGTGTLPNYVNNNTTNIPQ